MSSPTPSTSITELLNSPLVSSLLRTHPNDLSSLPIPACWRSWWSWASRPHSSQARWIGLVQYPDNNPDSTNHDNELPQDLKILLDDLLRLQLPRLPMSNLTPVQLDRESLLGMSPKKAHEVSRMAAYIAHLRTANPYMQRVQHVVDVGAGQAYLSRTVSTHLGLHVLALDFNDIQTHGAQRRDRRAERRRNYHSTGSLTHKTIRITAETLHAAIDDWITTQSPNHLSQEPIPVLIVALHACGSLVPDILRYFVAQKKNHPTVSNTTWIPAGLVVVGCCYNLMSPQDFPLSAEPPTPSSPPHTLPLSALHLASQIPAQWLTTPVFSQAAHLAIRKVVWRALLQRCILRAEPRDVGHVDGMGKNALNTRLGRIPDTAYLNWSSFLSAASARLPLNTTEELNDQETHTTSPVTAIEPSREDQSPLEVLHVLRCLIGPLVESLILLDRLTWLRDALDNASSDSKFDVNLVNLFDQATGSGRNIAIVAVPRV